MESSHATNTQTINVLIYNGNGTINNCVEGVKTCLTNVNNNNLLPGYTFRYSTSPIITSTILSHYDVLIMPGGSSGWKYINTLNHTIIQKYISNGHGYIGICAGAYAGSQNVDNLYPAFGVAPHIMSKVVTYEGTIPVTITQNGSKIFNLNNPINLAHYNGPAMYTTENSTIFATYTDNSTGYQDYGAIVGDTYGNGKTILSGPHPELDPQNPILLAKMIIWASNINSTNPPTTETSKTPQITPFQLYFMNGIYILICGAAIGKRLIQRKKTEV